MPDTLYSLCTFSTRSGSREAGLVLDDRVVSVARAAAAHAVGLDPRACASVLDLLQDWKRVETILRALAAACRQAPATIDFLDIREVQLHPPVDLPRQVFCTGANYRQHVIDLTLDMGVGPEGLDKAGLRRWAENMMDERAASGEPYVFTKPVSAIAGPFDPIIVPDTTTKLDWEIELGAVIGTGGYQITRDEALDYVAGYAIVNDLTARDLIARSDYKMLGTDWLKSKGQPGFLPFGPYLVPARFVPDPQNLRLKLSVSGATMQDESTADMLFDVARQIEYISRYVRLLPGDLICTGSPAGNGTHHGCFLQPGDIVIAEIDGLGRQHAPCIAAPGETAGYVGVA